MSTNTLTRHRFPWSELESERLWREYENRELTIQQIATLHQRTTNAILHKLTSERIIIDFGSARGYNEYAFKMGYPVTKQSLHVGNLEVKNLEDDTDYIEDEEEDNEDYSDEDYSDEDYIEDEDEDEDYVQDEEDEDEEDYNNIEEYDPYNMQQQMNFLQTQITNIKNIVSIFLNNSPKKRKVLAPLRSNSKANTNAKMH